jgi:mycofactocin biosynthetic radical S-adenosylmethionine protein MftC
VKHILIETLENWLETAPWLGSYYARRAGMLKRSYCLLLNHLGLLRPHAFVQWLATYQCIFACPYCEASAAKANPDELSTEEARTLMDEIRRMGASRVVISGGEPLTRADMAAVMAYANGLGLRLGLISNGYLVEEMWERLRHLRYFLFFTSIDGVKSNNDRLRAKAGAFDRTLRSLELFADIGVPIRMVNTAVHPGNIAQMQELGRNLQASGATHWHLSPIARVGRAAATDHYSLDGSQLRELADFIAAGRPGPKVELCEAHAYLGLLAGRRIGRPFFCGAGLTRCSVMPDGDVLGCQMIYDSRLSEGNIRDKPLSRIWRENFQRFRKPQPPPSCAGCSLLDSCQGGCWAEMETHGKCLKSVFEGHCG